ncbi:MAG TPA: acetate--CoA ligase [Vitreimonas sp.]|nr:acetate--CoA ligase [Vitreimonas sp.]
MSNFPSSPIPQIHSLEEYHQKYQHSLDQPAAFWAEIAQTYYWRKPWETVTTGSFEQADHQWFNGAELNITENCLDRHLETKGDQVALIWEPNNPDHASITLTYRQLYEKVCQASLALTELGVKKGDRVGIYLPMIPELAISMLACARIGAIHSVVFGGFSSQALADRLNDTQAKILITADGGFRGNKTIALKKIADEALAQAPHVEKCLVVKHLPESPALQPSRDIWWHEVVEHQATEMPAVSVEAEHPVFILYTSGSTGKPKGIVHATAGYMVYAGYSFVNVFQYQPGQIHWCTADCGWITGHTYLLYGPLLAGATTVMFEGIPTYPDAGRYWQIVEKHRVSILYTAPTVIRSLAAQSLDFVTAHDLSSLQVLGSVGEPINTEAWQWYHDHIGQGRCPIVDTWWQTETGGIVISPLAGITPLKPSYATLPLPGIKPVLVNDNGQAVAGNPASGDLCLAQPWPSAVRTIYGNRERYLETYFSRSPGIYFSGDGAERDAEGDYHILGRVDDTIKVSGHLIGSAEVENSLTQHAAVSEAAVIGAPHPIKGQVIHAFTILKIEVAQKLAQLNPESKTQEEAALKEALLAQVAHDIGSFAKPEVIYLVTNLPKTRSGKIMRRILRKIVEGDLANLGDTSTLVDPAVIEELEKVVGVAPAAAA